MRTHCLAEYDQQLTLLSVFIVNCQVVFQGYIQSKSSGNSPVTQDGHTSLFTFVQPQTSRMPTSSYGVLASYPILKKPVT